MYNIYLYVYTYKDVSEVDRNILTTFANDKKIDRLCIMAEASTSYSVNRDGYYY